MTVNKLFISLSLSLLSINAIAGMSDVAGDTTCTIVSSVDKKESVQIPCYYEGSVGASMTYAIQQIEFQMTNGNTVSINDSASFRFNEKREMQILSATTSIDDEPAEVINLHSPTLRQLSEAEVDKRHKELNPDFSDMLHCFKPEKQNSAFCIPYTLIQEIS